MTDRKGVELLVFEEDCKIVRPGGEKAIERVLTYPSLFKGFDPAVF